jgi:hypothetical protein
VVSELFKFVLQRYLKRTGREEVDMALSRLIIERMDPVDLRQAGGSPSTYEGALVGANPLE